MNVNKVMIKSFVIIILILNKVWTLMNGSQISETNFTVYKESLFWQRPVVLLIVPPNYVPINGNANLGFNTNLGQQRLNQRRNAALDSNSRRFNNRRSN
jgi:hypothetical protein